MRLVEELVWFGLVCFALGHRGVEMLFFPLEIEGIDTVCHDSYCVEDFRPMKAKFDMDE